MIDDEFQDEDSVEPGTIGVGMGGSCPTCRAPVELGQEFCLECGSPIRFTPRQRRKQRPGARPASAMAGSAAPARRKGSGFPWIPFLVVLALAGGGIGLALVENEGGGSSNRSGNGDSTEPPLPEITSEAPTTAPSTTPTVTLQDCDPAQVIGDTQPAVTDDTNSTDPFGDDGGEETIPELDSDGVDDSSSADTGFDDADDLPSIDPNESSGTVTLDQDGHLCDESGTSGTDTTDTSGTTDTTDTTTTPGSSASDSGAWPSGEAGWTVIVAGYSSEDRARQYAADLQEDGFDNSGVLYSNDFGSLCPGWYIAFSGVFDTDDEAEARSDQLESKGYAGMYVREVDPEGTRPDSCS